MLACTLPTLALVVALADPALVDSLTVLAGEKKEAGKSEEPKIHAKTRARIATNSMVIRSSEQLAKLRNTDPDKASAELAKMFKVESIDWKKRMVVVIFGGQQRTGGNSVEAKSLETKDGKLIVHWKLNAPGPGSIVTQAITYPTLTILVDLFEGDVVFDPPPSAGKK